MDKSVTDLLDDLFCHLEDVESGLEEARFVARELASKVESGDLGRSDLESIRDRLYDITKEFNQALNSK